MAGNDSWPRGTNDSSSGPGAVDMWGLTYTVMVLRVGISLFGLPANAMVVFVVYRFSDMRTYSNIFCASLAVVDNITLLHDLLITFPTANFELLDIAHSIPACLLFSVGNILTVGCGFHLLMIAFDRFLFINYPFHYRPAMKWAWGPLLLFCWLPGNLLGAAIEVRACRQQAFIDDQHNIYIRSAVFGMMAAVVSVLYACILVTALRQRRLIKRSMPASQLHARGSELDNIRAEIRALVGFILIGVSSFLNWIMPITYLLVVHYIVTQYAEDQSVPVDTLRTLSVYQQAMGVVMSLNSSVNPVIYSFTQRPFKDSFNTVLMRLVNKLSLTSSSSQWRTPSVHLMSLDVSNKRSVAPSPNLLRPESAAAAAGSSRRNDITRSSMATTCSSA